MDIKLLYNALSTDEKLKMYKLLSSHTFPPPIRREEITKFVDRVKYDSTGYLTNALLRMKDEKKITYIHEVTLKDLCYRRNLGEKSIRFFIENTDHLHSEIEIISKSRSGHMYQMIKRYLRHHY